ncbi:MAG: heliorhodopsin HeR [Mycobacteriales bacterium]|nr:heliorhodopsin HeR [Mycobacteriales bacterium]
MTIPALRRLNVVAAALHLVQAIAILALASGFALPVTASYLDGPPGAPPSQVPELLFELPTGGAVAAFLLLSAIAHAVVSTLWWSSYTADLERQRNPARWVEYSLSSSLMVVVIAQLSGISDVAALIALAGVNASMILFGWLQERYEQPGGGWLPFGFGCLAGAVPWIAIGTYLFSVGEASSEGAPGFVYAVFFSLFVFFNVFALNQWLQYRAVGRWRDYLFGERVYVWLSLTAKSVLAWQVFAGTLAT